MVYVEEYRLSTRGSLWNTIHTVSYSHYHKYNSFFFPTIDQIEKSAEILLLYYNECIISLENNYM
jgi:hypothetical protein